MTHFGAPQKQTCHEASIFIPTLETVPVNTNTLSENDGIRMIFSPSGVPGMFMGVDRATQLLSCPGQKSSAKTDDPEFYTPHGSTRVFNAAPQCVIENDFALCRAGAGQYPYLKKHE